MHRCPSAAVRFNCLQTMEFCQTCDLLQALNMRKLSQIGWAWLVSAGCCSWVLHVTWAMHASGRRGGLWRPLRPALCAQRTV